MAEEPMTISELYARGKENLETKIGWKRAFPPESRIGTSLQANRDYLDSLFFVPRYFDPVEPDTGGTLFGAKLKTPLFCSPISPGRHISGSDIADIARGLKNAGALMMLGMSGSNDLQAAIDTGVPVVKIIKPYRRTELVYEKACDAESRGCIAIGMDIDASLGAIRGGRITMSETFGPQRTDELKQLISLTKLPFIIKGVLSLADAEKAVQLGASSIIVSTHGAREVSRVPATMVLHKIAESYGDKLTVLVDSGFQTGSDVLKGLALGAKAVGLASSMILAWAADGAAGVELLTNQITAELGHNMAMTGCSALSTIARSIIVRVPSIDGY